MLQSHLVQQNRVGPTTHQELFAVKWGLEQFRPYILGHQIKVVTDHAKFEVAYFNFPKTSKTG